MEFNISPQELLQIIWCPALENISYVTKSRVSLESDEVSAQIKIAKGDLTWFRYKLRNRCFDGPGWRTTPLTDWTYGGPDDKFLLGSAVEESVYCLDPRHALTDRFTEKQAKFISNPFEELPFENPGSESLRNWAEKWKEITAYEEPPFPGYFCLKNIPGVRRRIHNSVVNFLRGKGYGYLTAVPTWWHTANICGHLGFQFQYEQDRIIIEKLNSVLPFNTEVQRRKSSWIVMLQFWAELAEIAGLTPENLVNKNLILRDTAGRLITFPLSPERNLWQIFKV